MHPRVKALIEWNLWQQGVRLGMNVNGDKTRFWVSIHPGESGLTHHQVLDRLLGSAP